ncbi:MAG: tyrosine--tRNA ligase [Candidatus Yanofskybacteria bacterium]|nr:tyrosine--tRNA ligase [Candidatus Yanofskybacteria bacterium]
MRVYLGIDPTGPNLHLGHTIPLLFLKQLLKLGHKPILVIGDFTARIGDPTGKETARKPLTAKEVKDNMKNYLGQVYKILPKGSFEVKYNSSWLSKMSFSDVVQLAGHVTIQQMIARDMFQDRLKNEKPIGVHEFLYPLMQGYDSVAMKIDGEVGGNDQTFNMLVGRKLEEKLIKKDKLVFATRLLVDAVSGKKMSKTEGGLISLGDSSQDIFGKTMKTIPDEMIATVFELCTEKPLEWVEGKKESDPYEFKKELAFELVRMYHDEEEAQKARDEWDKVFSKGEMPSEMETVSGMGQNLTSVIAGISQVSNTEAKKLLEQGAVRINDVVIKDWGHELKEGDIIQVGPKTFVKIK